MMMNTQNLQLTNEWDKTFPKSEALKMMTLSL